MKIYINELGHMTKMVAMPIYGKNPLIFFFTRISLRIIMKLSMWHWGCRTITMFKNYDPSLTLRYCNQGQVWSHRHSYGKSENYLFSKTIATYDLKVGRCIELNDLMMLHEYQRSRSLLFYPFYPFTLIIIYRFEDHFFP